MAALGIEVADQATQLEVADEEKSRVAAKVTDLREKLARAERKLAKLEAADVSLNIAHDEAIASRIVTQEELNLCKSDRYKKNIVDDFKSSAEYNEVIGREAGSFLDKGCVHIIRQLHPYFEDKSIILRDFEANFDNEACRQGANFVPFTAEEMDALRERDEQRGRVVWNPPPLSNPTFWDLLDGSNVPPPRNICNFCIPL